MNLCIPIEQDQGLASKVSGHFGSAPYFLIVDADTDDCCVVPNRQASRGQGRGHGQGGGCEWQTTLQGRAFEGVIIRGIGKGAAAKLKQAGIEIYLGQHRTVSELVTAYKSGQLKSLDPKDACGGHGHGNGHRHRHGACKHP